jgi:hypothetical protein
MDVEPTSLFFLYLFWAFYKIQKEIHVYKEIPIKVPKTTKKTKIPLDFS